ncbi:YokU family protein [Paenibacillus alginolyticus]|uniref:hypothetical protein n=1 Tax=Paenibacillus alginolyticus TaxID=59839 RepID=UPI000419E28E|nr:hypothetical protein [Paenibacillus alginolyticus]MCY9665873.1 YokU family protein [Paenibacillus alginolyticus]
MLKLKAIMRGKTTTDYIKGLVERDQPEPTSSKGYCFQCHEEHELIPNTVTESMLFRIGDEQKEIKVTEFPAQVCSKCGNTTISVGLAAEVESIVEEIVSERINRPAAMPLPEKVSFNTLLYGEAIA